VAAAGTVRAATRALHLVQFGPKNLFIFHFFFSAEGNVFFFYVSTKTKIGQRHGVIGFSADDRPMHHRSRYGSGGP
jgi:hypothetical protein